MKSSITIRRLAVAVLSALAISSASAADTVKVAIGQKGLWDTMVTVQGIEEGFFKKQ